MSHYAYTQDLQKLWEHAISLYENGNREPDSYFDEEQRQQLAACGLGVMDVYDYAEDYVSRGEPDFGSFITICAARRDYFLSVQNGKFSSKRLDTDSLPAKDAAIDGIKWLPRIIPKARAKLRGEMPPEIMYSCGGDRGFFRDNDIHPGEFLRVVWAAGDDDRAIVDWVKARRPA
jgi:hypothetical protein